MSDLIESIEDAVYEAVHELTGIDLGNYDEDTPEGAIGARILAVVGEEFEADPKYGVWIKHDGKLKTFSEHFDPGTYIVIGPVSDGSET